MKRLLTGLQPSGNLTIGNFAGGINQIVRYQESYESFLFIPDMHAITVMQNPKELQNRIREIVGLYIACGVDPKKNHIYIQSENLYHANLAWILECHSYFGEMSRMHQFKEKSAKNENFSCGLFTYPILMAADILLYDAEFVPTGIDQKQHVELARDIAIRFNNRYKQDCFVVPQPLIPATGSKIRDLLDPDKKMSKSAENPKGSIFLLDDDKVINSKVMGAKTDSDNEISFDEKNKPGISNLLTIYSVFSGESINDTIKRFKGAQYGTLKKEVAEVLINKLQEIRNNYKQIMETGLIDEILNEGRNYSNEIAKLKYEKIRDIVGLGRKLKN